MKNTDELYLVLQKKWFIKILKGEKKTEYRAFTDFYMSRLCEVNKANEAECFKDIKTVRLCLGYAKDRPEMIVEIAGLFIEKDDEEQDDLTTENCEFAIDLGKIIETIRCENLI